MHAIDINSGGYTGGFNVSETPDGMQVTSFAKPGGARKMPRTRAHGSVRAMGGGSSFSLTTDCLVTRADGSRYRIAKGTRKATPSKPRAHTGGSSRVYIAPEAARIVSSFDTRHAVAY